MSPFMFSKWSPGGNTTLLFTAPGLAPAQQAELARRALDPSVLGGEQAGFVDRQARSLRMAGGEFCVNASRAVGALLASEEERASTAAAPQKSDQAARTVHRYEISVSGWQSPVRLLVRGGFPLWQVEAVLRLPEILMECREDGICLVRLPGICHLLLDARIHGHPDDCRAAAALLRRRYSLEQEDAVGVIWWQVLQGQLDMLPLVHVRDTRTDYLESACGSGALALALARNRFNTSGDKKFSIMQPGGSPLDVRLFSEDGDALAGVDGPVALVADGQVWLPDGAI